ncbi:hypothetical protein AMELA_G00109410 [Ameiurus melas]|uniref:Legumain n=1 Tax=Ameiurus melas TaxID=219545 RepID=A0A7J6API1_AMEME|nr:hypothetical protein AMELA_G00109410 [Ameiurus melas]
MVKNHKFSKMVIYMESCHSGSMLYQLSERNVYGVTACKPDDKDYACFLDETRNTCLADLFSYVWLNHTERVNTCSTSFGQQFIYVKEQVSKAAKKKGESQTPCNYGDMGMLKVMLSEFLGVSFASFFKRYMPKPLDFLLSDVVDTTEVPLIIQENRIKNEQDPEKRQALQRQYDDLKRKRKIVDEALQKIAERTNASRALTEKREVTQTYKLKLVAEHFRKNLFNWEKEQV